MLIKIGDTTRIKSRPKGKVLESDGAKVVFRKDRRKRKTDRRKSVRDGIYVSFSFKKDRRSGKDRRKRNTLQ